MSSPEHAAYIEAAPAPAKELLREVAELVRQAYPEAEACIGYQMPAFRDKRIFVYFGAFKKHIGVYPPVTTDLALVARLEPWRGPKGNLKFPYEQSIPWALLREVVEALHGQYA